MQQGNSVGFSTKFRGTGWIKKTTLAHFSNLAAKKKTGSPKFKLFSNGLSFFGSWIAISPKNPDTSYGKGSVSVNQDRQQNLTPQAWHSDRIVRDWGKVWLQYWFWGSNIAPENWPSQKESTCYASFREGILGGKSLWGCFFFITFSITAQPSKTLGNMGRISVPQYLEIIFWLRVGRSIHSFLGPHIFSQGASEFLVSWEEKHVADPNFLVWRVLRRYLESHSTAVWTSSKWWVHETEKR